MREMCAEIIFTYNDTVMCRCGCTSRCRSECKGRLLSAGDTDLQCMLGEETLIITHNCVGGNVNFV